MTEKENYYHILTNLKLYTYELSNINTLEDVDIHITKIKAFIFSHQILKEKFLMVYEQVKNEIHKTKDDEFINLYNQLLTKAQINQQNGYTITNWMGWYYVSLSNDTSDYTVDLPNLFYYSSLSLIKKEKFLNQLPISISHLYFELLPNSFALITGNIPDNIEFYMINQELQTINTNNHKFTTIFLLSALYYVLNYLKNYMLSKINKEYFNDTYKHITVPLLENIHNSPLNELQIQILKLRKTLSPNNTYELMGKHLPGIKINNLKRIAREINTKLGGNNIDESLRLFEDQYFKLS